MATEEYGVLWDAVKSLVESADLDVAKNAAGNAAAGNRLRKVLRELLKAVRKVKVASLTQEKAARAERKAAKDAKKAEKAQ